LGKNTCHAAITGLVLTLGSTASLAAGTLRISSPDVQPNATLPPSATCDGAGRSPELQFSGAPAAAKSLVLIVVDPDVPKAIKPDGRYLHWAVWDLPPDTTTIADVGSARSVNENGGGGYIPACPPNGEHRYVFQLFALDTTFGNRRITNEADLRRAMEGHTLDQAELVGRYTTRTFNIVRIVLAGVILLVVFFVVRRVITRRRAMSSGSM
jgi:Raf kinase inhibitor-like YbhB/YbcL family protein